MKAKFISVVALLVVFAVPALGFGGKVSFKYLKKELKKDASAESCKRLAEEVLNNGVKFVYSQARDAELRRLGATDMLITAVYTAVVEESSEDKMWDEFMENYDRDEKERREKAYKTGLMYLRSFGERARFSEHFERVKQEMEKLSCEFDFEKGC